MNNKSIKPIGRYDLGGTSDDSCMEEYIDRDGKKKKRRRKGCGYAASQRYNQRQTKKEKRQKVIKKVVAGVGAAGAGAGAYFTNLFGIKDKIDSAIKKQAKGGPVKKKSGGPVVKRMTTKKK